MSAIWVHAYGVGCRIVYITGNGDSYVAPECWEIV